MSPYDFPLRNLVHGSPAESHPAKVVFLAGISLGWHTRYLLPRLPRSFAKRLLNLPASSPMVRPLERYVGWVSSGSFAGGHGQGYSFIYRSHLHFSYVFADRPFGESYPVLGCIISDCGIVAS